MGKVDSVAVIGGGPAGATAARVLALAGISVLLSDARPAKSFVVGESLVPAAGNILRELDVWERFLAEGHLCSYGNLSAWGSPELIDNDFIRSPYGHGWHLDRARFDAMLREMAAEAGATTWESAKLIRIGRATSVWQLGFKTPEGIKEVACKWLIDCTGRSGRVAARLGIARHYEDRLVGFYARFRADRQAEKDQDSRTLVESAPRGWFHTALLPEGDRIVTFFTDADAPWTKTIRSREGFLAAIGETFHVSQKLRAHGYAISEMPRGTDARSGRLERFHGEGWLAAGDAATTFDPLSSQGILSALYSGMKAGQALVDFTNREVLGQYDALLTSVYNSFLDNRLEYYRSERRWHNEPFWRARIDARASR